MPKSKRHEDVAAAKARRVPATFGSKQVQADPESEVMFSNLLRQSYRLDKLQALFGRFRSGEDSFDVLMRRMLLRAMCRKVGNALQVEANVVFKHPETMEFGNKVFIGAQAMIQGRFDGTCKIGNHVWIGPQAYMDARNLVIEDFVGWGPGARVLGSEHTGEPLGAPMITTGLMIKPVVVGFGADIGMNAAILPGVTIGEHSIVGAGAVVTRDVPAYAIVAGVPAKVLRMREDK